MSNIAIDKTLSQMDERIIRFMNKYVLSGAAVGVVHNGEMIFGKGYGLARYNPNRPVTTDTNFRIASISKTFTAIAVMQLWEQGKLGLEDPVNEHLRSLQVVHPDRNAPPVTVRHLLTHTSGIGEMRNNLDLFQALVIPNYGTYKLGEVMPSPREYYHGLLKPDVYPDKKWAYANHAFAVLGQVIEDISGEPFTVYMLRHVLEPLGMTKSDFLLSDRVRDELAQGYQFKKGRLKSVEYREFPDLAAGSLMTSVNEMARYLTTLMSGGCNTYGAVLKPETLKLMMTPHYQQDPHLAAMGLGFFLETVNGNPAAWHGGALEGFNSAMWVAPEEKLGLVLFINSNTRMVYAEAQNILRDLIGLPDKTNQYPLPGVAYQPHLWQEFTGSYGPYPGMNSNARIWLGFGGEIEIYVKGNQLMLRSFSGSYSKGIPLYPMDADNPLVFENVTDGKSLQLVFQRNAEGFIDRVDMTSLTFFTFYKRPVTQSLRFRLMTSVGALLGSILSIILLRKRAKKPTVTRSLKLRR